MFVATWRSTCFDRLDGALDRAYLEVAGGTHMMLMEPVRRTAFEQIVGFVTTAFSGGVDQH